ncbi:MAG: hypothetical protein ACREXR_03085, partial [Gammaproteobacteria bacterium]
RRRAVDNWALRRARCETLTGLRHQRAQSENDLCIGITGSPTGDFHLHAHVGRTKALQPTATCVRSSLASAFGRA